MAKLTRVEYSYNFLYLRFECEPIGSDVIYVNYSDGTENKVLPPIKVSPGVDIDIKFYINYLNPNTEYYVQVYDKNENQLAVGYFTTGVSRNAPSFMSHSIKIEGGVIKCDFTISNLNVERESNTYVWGSNVWLYIDGEVVDKWNGDDITDISDSSDDTGWDIKRGSLTVAKTYDFPGGETCVVKISARNTCDNIITGNAVYDDETFREKTITFPFAWELPKVVGERIRLGANEWNRFIGKIKNKLSQKGISYSKEFTTAVSAGFVGRNVGTSADGLSIDSPKVISKKILCEAVDALNAMLPADEKISYPTGIAVDFLNNIVDKLNSI